VTDQRSAITVVLKGTTVTDQRSAITVVLNSTTVTTDEGNSTTLLAWYGVVGTVYVKKTNGAGNSQLGKLYDIWYVWVPGLNT
jgi:hypothetical protein